MESQTLPSSEGAAEARLRRRLIVFVSLGALALFLASGAIAVLVGEDRAATDWVNHTYLVKGRLADLRLAYSRAETARRGFLITREPYYVQQYESSTAPVMDELGAIKALTADNPRQQRAADRLRGLLEASIVDQRSTIQTVEIGEARDIRPLILDIRPRALAIRDLLDDMAAAEDRLLAMRHTRQARDSMALLIVAIAASAVLVLLAAASFALVRRYARDLNLSRAALRQLNAGLEAAVAARTAELTRANAEIQRFAYIVSHDLRSPLVNVMGFTSELELTLKPLKALLALPTPADAAAARTVGEAREAVEADIPEALGFIRTSTQKMDRLINAILKLSREGGRVLAAEPVAMADLMRQITDSLKSQTEQRGAALEIDPGLPNLTGDRVAIEQVFSNILENALKYLKPGRAGHIAVRGRRAGAMLIYEVQDNGRGIAPHDHERVFDLFRRAGPQDQPGEGIGLAHVRALVHRMGGTIGVQSELDQGATFRVCLPPSPIRPEEAAA